MICYLDRTFCSQPLDKCTCDEYRQMTHERQEQARLWWRTLAGEPPVAYSKLCNGDKT